MNKRTVFLLVLFAMCFGFSREQLYFPGQHAEKFAVADQLKSEVYDFDLQDVRLLDSRFKQNMEREQKWLQSIEVNRLLHSFRNNAGVYSGNEGGYFKVKKLAGMNSLYFPGALFRSYVV